MENLRFSQEIPFLPLLSLAYYRYFSRPTILLVYAVGLLNLGMIFSSWSDQAIPDMDQLPFWIMLTIFVLLPLMVYLNTRTLYDTTQMFQEPVKYEVSGEGIALTGETFAMRYEWEAIYEVREYRYWMVIFLSRYQTVYLQREALDDTDWEILRAIVRNVPDMDVRLRR